MSRDTTQVGAAPAAQHSGSLTQATTSSSQSRKYFVFEESQLNQLYERVTFQDRVSFVGAKLSDTSPSFNGATFLNGVLIHVNGNRNIRPIKMTEITKPSIFDNVDCRQIEFSVHQNDEDDSGPYGWQMWQFYPGRKVGLAGKPSVPLIPLVLLTDKEIRRRHAEGCEMAKDLIALGEAARRDLTKKSLCYIFSLLTEKLRGYTTPIIHDIVNSLIMHPNKAHELDCSARKDTSKREQERKVSEILEMHMDSVKKFISGKNEGLDKKTNIQQDQLTSFYIRWLIEINQQKCDPNYRFERTCFYLVCYLDFFHASLTKDLNAEAQNQAATSARACIPSDFSIDKHLQQHPELKEFIAALKASSVSHKNSGTSISMFPVKNPQACSDSDDDRGPPQGPSKNSTGRYAEDPAEALSGATTPRA